MKNKIYLLFAALFVLALLAFAAHSLSLKNSFYFDDSHILVKNQAIRSLKNIPRLFYDITTSSCDYNNYQYRPIVTLSYALNYKFNKLNPFGYHCVNLTIHILCGFLLFLIINFLIKKWLNVSESFAYVLALIGAAFFIVTPQNVETINYCSARSSSFATFFYLLGFWIYLHARQKHWSLYILVVLCMILGLMCKDIIGTLPVLLIFYEYWERSRKNYHNPKHKTYRDYMPFILFGIILFLYILRGIYIVGDDRFANQFSGELTEKIATQSRAHLHYIRQFFAPGDFPIDPVDFGFSKLSDPRSIVSIFTLLGFAVFIFSGKRKLPLLTFGLLWYFLALSPSSGIANTTQPINYHRPYIAIPGLCCALTAVIFYIINFLKDKFNKRFAETIVFWLVLSVLSWNIILSREQNKIWNNKTKLWEVAVKCSPSSGRAHLNLGLQYMSENKFQDAEREFKKCVELWPGYPYAYVNLGILYNHQGDANKADKFFLKAYKIWPKHKIVGKYYADYLFNKGKYQKAVNVLTGIIDNKPESANLRLLRAKNYYYLKRYNDAINDFYFAANFIPPSKETILYMCVALDKLKQYNKMFSLINDWKKNNKPDNKILYNEAYALMRLGKYKDAQKAWNNYLNNNPEDIKAQSYMEFCKKQLKH